MDLMPTKIVDEALVVGRPSWTADNMEPWRGQFCPLRAGLPPTLQHSMSGDMGGFWVPQNQRALSPFPVPPSPGHRFLPSTIPKGEPMNSADSWKRGTNVCKINPNHSQHDDEVDPMFTTPQSIW